MLTTGRVGMTRRSWSVVQIFNLGNNTQRKAVKISDFGNGEPLPTEIRNICACRGRYHLSAVRTAIVCHSALFAQICKQP